VITSATLQSSIATRLRHLAGRVHRLGPRPLFELMCELAGGADPITQFENYAKLDADFIRAMGGDVMPPPAILVRP
jgi:hypothetical protein